MQIKCCQVVSRNYTHKFHCAGSWSSELKSLKVERPLIFHDGLVRDTSYLDQLKNEKDSADIILAGPNSTNMQAGHTVLLLEESQKYLQAKYYAHLPPLAAEIFNNEIDIKRVGGKWGLEVMRSSISPEGEFDYILLAKNSCLYPKKDFSARFLNVFDSVLDIDHEKMAGKMLVHNLHLSSGSSLFFSTEDDVRAFIDIMKYANKVIFSGNILINCTDRETSKVIKPVKDVILCIIDSFTREKVALAPKPTLTFASGFSLGNLCLVVNIGMPYEALTQDEIEQMEYEVEDLFSSIYSMHLAKHLFPHTWTVTDSGVGIIIQLDKSMLNAG